LGDAHVELGLSAHLAVRALDGTDVPGDPRDEERGHHPLLQPALASVVAQGPAQGRRLDSGLELGDPLVLPPRLAVHGILKPLHELLQVSDPGLERVQLILPRTGGGRPGPLTGFRSNATHLPDTHDQSLTLARTHGRPGRFGSAERAWGCRRSSSVIWRIANDPLSISSRLVLAFPALAFSREAPSSW
jgi:hypothetical protein